MVYVKGKGKVSSQSFFDFVLNHLSWIINKIIEWLGQNDLGNESSLDPFGCLHAFKYNFLAIALPEFLLNSLRVKLFWNNHIYLIWIKFFLDKLFKPSQWKLNFNSISKIGK